MSSYLPRPTSSFSNLLKCLSKKFLHPPSLQDQKLDYDELTVKEQVIDSFKHIKVIEWLKDSLPRTVVPYKASSGV